MADEAKLDRISDVIAAHWPETIAPDQLGNSALVSTVRKAREALLDACGLAELR
jgi:succinylarginine dihydrolase